MGEANFLKSKDVVQSMIWHLNEILWYMQNKTVEEVEQTLSTLKDALKEMKE